MHALMLQFNTDLPLFHSARQARQRSSAQQPKKQHVEVGHDVGRQRVEQEHQKKAARRAPQRPPERRIGVQEVELDIQAARNRAA